MLRAQEILRERGAEMSAEELQQYLIAAGHDPTEAAKLAARRELNRTRPS